jgi:Tol biopolymer transport system component
MGARVVLITGIALGLIAQGSAPVAAKSDREVTIRVVVDGRLMGHKATLKIHDRSGAQTVRVRHARKVRVHAGRTTVVPAPIRNGRPSTSTIQQIRAANGTVVRVRYRKDVTSRPGPLTPLATGPDGKPATGWDWVQSPDTSRLAFTSSDPSLLAPDEDSGLFVRDLTTGSVAKAANDALGEPSWSPDSQRIAFVSDAALTPQDRNGKADVYVKDLATGGLILVSARTAANPFHAATGAAWVDDDHLVLFGCDTAQQYRKRRCGIRVTTLSTGETREIVPADHRIRAWRLAPDGRRVVFESEGDPLHLRIHRRALYVTDLSTAATALLSSNKKGHPANRPAWGAVWSPDAREVAFRSTADNLVARDTNGKEDPLRGTDVFIKELNSGKVTRISTTSSGKQMTGEPGPRDEPAAQWSPNGKVVAFRFRTTSPRGDRRPPGSDVFIKRLSSGRLEPLVPRTSRLPRSPVVDGYVFSPSGDRIAFRFRPRNGCWTDVVPFANLNCHNVIVREVGGDRLANVSTLDTGLGWLGGPQDSSSGPWSPVWLSDDELLFPVPGRSQPRRTGGEFPVIKAVEWAPAPVRYRSPAPWTPAWCDPYRYWWSC